MALNFTIKGIAVKIIPTKIIYLKSLLKVENGKVEKRINLKGILNKKDIKTVFF